MPWFTITFKVLTTLTRHGSFQYLNNTKLKSLGNPDFQGGMWVGQCFHWSWYSILQTDLILISLLSFQTTTNFQCTTGKQTIPMVLARGMKGAGTPSQNCDTTFREGDRSSVSQDYTESRNFLIQSAIIANYEVYFMKYFKLLCVFLLINLYKKFWIYIFLVLTNIQDCWGSSFRQQNQVRDFFRI